MCSETLNPHCRAFSRLSQCEANGRIERAIQPAAGDDGRRLLFERSGSGIARIGEQGIPGRFAFGIEPIERSVGHQNLPADFEIVGPSAALQPERNGSHGSDIGGNIIALRTVSARYGPQQPSVLVGERDGRTVEFELADVLRRPGFPLDAVDELVQFVQRIGIAQRAHRETVFHRNELGRQVAAHPHRRGIGIGELGMLRLEILQFAHERIELEIGDFGRIVDVIPMIVIFQLPAQLLDSFAYSVVHIDGNEAVAKTVASSLP